MEYKIDIGGRDYEISLPGYTLLDEDMVVYRDCMTKVRSVRFVKIDTDNKQTEDSFREKLVEAYLDNHDDSTDCVTVEISLSDETKAFLDEICNTCEISIYAFAKGISVCFPLSFCRIYRICRQGRLFYTYSGSLQDTFLR